MLHFFYIDATVGEKGINVMEVIVTFYGAAYGSRR